MPGLTSIGDVVHGRYRVEQELGRGAGGFSYKGQDLETLTPVVIKELPGDSRPLFGRYQGEVAVLSELKGQFSDPVGMERLVAPVAVVAEHDRLHSVRPFVEGRSLRERMNEGGLAEEEIRTILGDVLRGLGAAHQENLVFRNLKPENILVESGGRAYLTGLGTGCFLTRARRESLGVKLGGLQYVAPEQLLDARRVDRRTDLFTVGLILYELLAGEPLVQGESVNGILDFLSRPFHAPAPGGSPQLSELALRLIHFQPAQRPPEAAAVLQELAPWVQGVRSALECEGCGTRFAGTAAYCPSCGRASRGPCPHCAAPVPRDASFCRNCGERVGVAPVCRLVGLTGSFRGEVVSLPRSGEVYLGRAPTCEISFENRDQYVSRHQAVLRCLREKRWIEGGDWNSGRPTTNGTLLNGRNLDGQGLVLLRHKDRLRVGDSFFRYEELTL